LTQILEWGLRVAETAARESATAPTEGKLPARRKMLEALRSTGLVVELDATLATRYRADAAQPRRTPVYVQGKPLSEVVIAERGLEWRVYRKSVGTVAEPAEAPPSTSSGNVLTNSFPVYSGVEDAIMSKLLTWNEYVRLALSYATFNRNEDGSWTVDITVLPGCVTWGATRAEAAVMAEDAVQGWLMTALRFGDEAPVIDDHRLGYLVDANALAEVVYA
jgi:predicted RNase H-like HicB family nuclease